MGLRERLNRSRWLAAVTPVLLAGLVVTAVAIAERESDSAFVYDQTHAERIEPADVETAVLRAPEPAPERRPGGRRATCRPGEVGDLRNPWRCRVVYPSGTRIRYTVRIDQEGRFRGVDRTGRLRISGCCVGAGS